MEYISAATAEDRPPEADACVFCEIQSPGDDRSRLLVFRGQRTQVVLNRYPYNNGHLLVMPRAHLGHFDDLDAETFAELNELVHRSVKVLERAMRPDGMNIGVNLGRVAGAGMPGHLHYHLVPRWNGDTNFMAVTGLSKVISQHLLETWDQLHPLFG
jgi:ATP adenylyltransferase